MTALGGVPVLGLAGVVVFGYMLLRRQYGRAIYLAVVTGGGSLVSYILKFAFDRPRPTIVEPLDVTATASFPSGHSMSAAFVYLTFAALMTAGESRRSVKVYVIGVAFLATVLVGLSRILLAAHYPTDVLAGWSAGLAWAVGCWIGWSMWGEAASDEGESGESE
jgi:undecaprenyl-diphosphatase